MASLSHPDRTGLKEQLIQGLWLTQAGGMELEIMQGEPVAADALLVFQQPEARLVFSWGSCPWIMRPWQWQAAQAPRREGVASDLCLHTGFLLAAAVTLAFMSVSRVHTDSHSSHSYMELIYLVI